MLEAFEDYVRGRGSQLLRTAYLLTGDPQIAEDVVQNALASVLASWRRLRDVTDLDAYVYTALVHARGRWWRRRWHGEVPAEFLPDAPAADETGRYDSYDAMVTALRTIPARQRAALVLRYYEDLSEEQTAAVLGCSVGTVKSQTARGLAKLRDALVAAADDRPPAVAAPRSVPAPPPVAAPPATSAPPAAASPAASAPPAAASPAAHRPPAVTAPPAAAAPPPVPAPPAASAPPAAASPAASAPPATSARPTGPAPPDAHRPPAAHRSSGGAPPGPRPARYARGTR